MPRLHHRLLLSLAAVSLLIGCGGESATTAGPAPAVAPGSTTGPGAPDAGGAPEAPDEPDAPEDGASTALETDPLGTADSAYAELLATIVTDDGLVRYRELARSAGRERLATVVAGYAATDVPEDESARLAFLMNAYNANVLEQVLREFRRTGFTTVQRVEGFFDVRFVRIAGERLTLNALENDRIRPIGDARIHAALVCAAKSCPPLRAEPYAADRLDEQLDEQCQRWVGDESKFRLEAGVAGFSAILDWYGDDFHELPYGGPRGFVLGYAGMENPLVRYLVNESAPTIVFLPYDWTLNDAGTAAP